MRRARLPGRLLAARDRGELVVDDDLAAIDASVAQLIDDAASDAERPTTRRRRVLTDVYLSY